MYEQYTDKQIVEMLKPKLAKLGWGNVVNNDLYPDTCKMIAAIYRSAYIRGQLGWSFIIGEPKQTEHWVPATRDNVKVGSKVRMIDDKVHNECPRWFPVVGTVGAIINVSDTSPYIQWPSGTTSDNDRWFCSLDWLEVLLCE